MLLEPFYTFRLRVPAENVGRAMSDMERMQGVFEPPQTEGEMAVLSGSGPASRLRDYQREVIRYTRGRGTFTCTLKGYEPCHNEEEVVKASGYDPEADLDNPTGSVFCSHGAGFVVPWDQVKDYMHVEALSIEEETEDEEETERERPSGRGKNTRLPFGVEDKELEAIFARTYGEPKRKRFYEDGPRQVTYKESWQSGEETKQRTWKGTEEKKEEYLLVDGYNIIYAWEELRELAGETIDGARYHLMDILCNYQAFRQCILIVVFDAYKVSGNKGNIMDYHNIHVAFTKEAETADQYIEKFAYQMGKNAHVTVATSDGLEQLIIRGAGCLLMSAKDLWEDVQRIRELIREEQEKLPKGEKMTVFQNFPENLEKLFKIKYNGHENRVRQRTG